MSQRAVIGNIKSSPAAARLGDKQDSALNPLNPLWLRLATNVPSGNLQKAFKPEAAQNGENEREQERSHAIAQEPRVELISLRNWPSDGVPDPPVAPSGEPDPRSDWQRALRQRREHGSGLQDLPAEPGRPLPPTVRERMEATFDHDFSHVRIHTDAGAGDASQKMHAQAVTRREHIFFGHGQFAPGTAEGDRLLLHELTHVVQADEGRLPVRVGLSAPTDPHEREAYAAETKLPGQPAAIGSQPTVHLPAEPAQGAQPISARQSPKDELEPHETQPQPPEHPDGASASPGAQPALPPAAAPAPTQPSGPAAPHRSVPSAASPEEPLVQPTADAATKGLVDAGLPPSSPPMRETPPGASIAAPVLPAAPVLALPGDWSAHARYEGQRASRQTQEAAESAMAAVRASAQDQASSASAAFANAQARLMADAAAARLQIQRQLVAAKGSIGELFMSLQAELDAGFAAREETARAVIDTSRQQLAEGVDAEAERVMKGSEERAERARALAEIEGSGGDEPLLAAQRDIARQVADEVAAQCVQTGADAAVEVRKAETTQLAGLDAHRDEVLETLAEARERAHARLGSMHAEALASLEQSAMEASAELDACEAEGSAGLASRESELTSWILQQANKEVIAIETEAAALSGSIDEGMTALASEYEQGGAGLEAALADSPDATPESVAEANAGLCSEFARLWQQSAAPLLAHATQASAAIRAHSVGVCGGFVAVVEEAATSSQQASAEQGEQLRSIATRYSDAYNAVEAKTQQIAEQGVAGDLAEADRALAAQKADLAAAVSEALGHVKSAVDEQLDWEDGQIVLAAERIRVGHAQAATEYEEAKLEAQAKDQNEETISRGWLGELWDFFSDLAERTLEWFQEKLGRIWGNIIGWILKAIVYVIGVVVCAVAWVLAQVVNLIWGFIWGETAIPGYGGGFFAFVADVVAGILVYGDVRDIFKYWIWRPLWGEGPWWLNLLLGGLALVGLIPVFGDGIKAVLKGVRAGSKTALRWLSKLVGEELAERIARMLGKEAADQIARRFAEKLGNELAEKLLKELGVEALDELLERLGQDTLRKLAQDLSGTTIKNLTDQLGETLIRKLAQEISGTAIEKVTGDLGKDALEKLLRTVGGATIAELNTHLGKDAVLKLLEGLRGVTIKEYYDALGGSALRSLAKDLDGYAVKELMDALGAPVLKEFAERIAPTTIRDLADTLGKDLVLRLRGSIGVDGLKQITDAMTPAQLKAFVDTIGTDALEQLGARALAEVGRHLSPTDLLDLLTTPHTTMGFLRNLCEEGGAGAALKLASGHFGSIANLGKVLARAEQHGVPASGLKEFLEKCPAHGWKKLDEITQFFRYAASSGATWRDVLRWGETLTRNTLGDATMVAGRTVADPSAPYFRDLLNSAGNTVRITFNSVDAAHVASRHTWDRFAVSPGNAKLSNSMLPEVVKAADIEAIGARLLQDPMVANLVSRLASGASDVVHIVDAGITYEVRITLQGGVNGMVSFYPVAGPGVVTLSRDAMRAIIWLWKSI